MNRLAQLVQPHILERQVRKRLLYRIEDVRMVDEGCQQNQRRDFGGRLGRAARRDHRFGRRRLPFARFPVLPLRPELFINPVPEHLPVKLLHRAIRDLRRFLLQRRRQTGARLRRLKPPPAGMMQPQEIHQRRRPSITASNAFFPGFSANCPGPAPPAGKQCARCDRVSVTAGYFSRRPRRRPPARRVAVETQDGCFLLRRDHFPQRQNLILGQRAVPSGATAPRQPAPNAAITSRYPSTTTTGNPSDAACRAWASL